MNDFQSGLYEVIVGIVMGIAISAIMKTFQDSGLVPSNMVFLFTIIGFIGSLATLFSFWKTGIVFTIGWIIGAWILKDVLSPGDFLLYFVAPIIALIIRAVVFFRNQSS